MLLPSGLLTPRYLWDPNQLGGQLARWLRSDRNVIPATAPLANGSALIGWNGCGSAGAMPLAGPQYSQSTAAAQPTYILSDAKYNGYPSVQFGAALYFGAGTNACNLFGSFANVARFFVVNLTTLPTGSATPYLNLTSITTSAASNRFSIAVGSTGLYWTIRPSDGDAGTTASTPYAITANTANILCVWRNGATVSMIVNGTVVNTQTLIVSDATAAFPNNTSYVERLGSSNTASTGWTGTIAEAFDVINPTQAIIDQCNGYAAWRYSLQSTLPSSHPFKAYAPTVEATPTVSNKTHNGVLITSAVFLTATQTANSTNATSMQSITQDGTYLYVFQETGNGVQADCQIYNLSTKVLVSTALKSAAPHSSSASIRGDRGTIITSSAGDNTIYAIYETQYTPSTGAFTVLRQWNQAAADTNGFIPYPGGATANYVGPYDATSHLQIWSGVYLSVLSQFMLVRCFDNGTFTVMEMYYSTDVGVDQDSYYDPVAQVLYQLQCDSTYLTAFVKAFTFGPTAIGSKTYGEGYATMTGYYLNNDGISQEPEGICANPAGGILWGRSNYRIAAATLV